VSSHEGAFGAQTFAQDGADLVSFKEIIDSLSNAENQDDLVCLSFFLFSREDLCISLLLLHRYQAFKEIIDSLANAENQDELVCFPLPRVLRCS
jgi:hypothetical protein